METETITVGKEETYIFKGRVGEMTLNFPVQGCSTEEEARLKLIDLLTAVVNQLKASAPAQGSQAQ